MRRTSIGLALTLAVVAVSASPAAAAPSEITIEINNNGSPNKLQGVVSSPRGACRGGRKVKLFYDAGGGFERVGTDNNTSDAGVWRLFYNPKRGGPPIPEGDYKAKVTRKLLGAGQCDPATSETLKVT